LVHNLGTRNDRGGFEVGVSDNVYTSAPLMRTVHQFRLLQHGIYGVISANLFDSVVRLSTSRQISRISNLFRPRPFRRTHAQWPDGEESEVAVCHVAVLSVE